jgi:hypothetical protein
LKVHAAFVFRVKQFKKLLDPEDKNTAVLGNNDKYFLEKANTA